MPKIVPIKILKIMKEEYEILKLGNPILRRTAKEVSKEEILSENSQNLIDEMWNVMEKAGGIGLAAPQIGISIQLAVIKLESSCLLYTSDAADEP